MLSYKLVIQRYKCEGKAAEKRVDPTIMKNQDIKRSERKNLSNFRKINQTRYLQKM